jgi:hypothetical protein
MNIRKVDDDVRKRRAADEASDRGKAAVLEARPQYLKNRQKASCGICFLRFREHHSRLSPGVRI